MLLSLIKLKLDLLDQQQLNQAVEAVREIN